MDKRFVLKAEKKHHCAVFYWGAIILLTLCFGCTSQNQQPWQGYNIPPAPRDGGQSQPARTDTGRTQTGYHNPGTVNNGRYDTRGTDLRGGYSADGRYVGRYDSGEVARSGGLPVDYQDFKARYARQAVTPEGAVKLYFDAVFCYINPATRAEASKMLRYSMRLQQGWERGGLYQTFVSRMVDPYYSHIFRSFAAGTSVHNGYAMSPDNYRLDVIKIWDGHSTGDLQVSLRSSGADNPRPVYVRQYDGLWFVTNNAATYTEVRRPQTERDRTGHDADYDNINY